ncbi:ATP-binding protein [Streptomyces lydicus]|uniref:ATP-binding protein n=1 Tax=Streptomyces lydicus TaxID=47763 RepID=UPI0010114781|nr:ATP-binding protein [Streptomyces lydicus]MCZ1009884.1 ATP-binding protein [Streptomyces lydicus]
MVEPHTAEILYAPTPDAPGAVRAFISGQLTQLGSEHDRLDDMLVCASELSTNAVRYGARDHSFRVRLIADTASVRIEVYDFGRDMPRVCRICEVRHTVEHGRGLLVVKELSDAWGVDRHPRIGKTVWCEFKTDAYAAGVEAAAVAYRTAPTYPPPVGGAPIPAPAEKGQPAGAVLHRMIRPNHQREERDVQLRGTHPDGNPAPAGPPHAPPVGHPPVRAVPGRRG